MRPNAQHHRKSQYVRHAGCQAHATHSTVTLRFQPCSPTRPAPHLKHHIVKHRQHLHPMQKQTDMFPTYLVARSPRPPLKVTQEEVKRGRQTWCLSRLILRTSLVTKTAKTETIGVPKGTPAARQRHICKPKRRPRNIFACISFTTHIARPAFTRKSQGSRIGGGRTGLMPLPAAPHPRRGKIKGRWTTGLLVTIYRGDAMG